MKVCKVIWFNDTKGFGYLREEGVEAPRDLFVHYTAIRRDGFKSLTEGERVACEILDGPKGPQAWDVYPLAKLSTADIVAETSRTMEAFL